MINTRKNLEHLNDNELDKCECGDPMCPACYGECHEQATITMFRTDFQISPQDISGLRMCHDCSVDAFESGVFESDGPDAELDAEPE